MSIKEIIVQAPGRVCLFGEHQDYLRLPVISAAISLYINISAVPRDEKCLSIDLLNLNQREIIPLKNIEVEYAHSRDYLRSAYNLFIRSGYRMGQGYQLQIQGNIPIKGGVGSSSALVVAWVSLLSLIFNAHNSEEQIAELAHQAEVDEFREAGGRMDHYTSALGGVLYLTNTPPFKYERFKAPLTGLILGDSREKKETVSDLMRIREQLQIGISRMRREFEGFNIRESRLDEVSKALSQLPQEMNDLLTANLINRDLTQEAKQLLSGTNFSPEKLGELLNLHHTQLLEKLKISTPKIEKIISAAREAGALGCKINGSGLGGCMIAYAPDEDQQKRVISAIEKAGGKAHPVSVSEKCQTTVKR
jgi:galactokinase